MMMTCVQGGILLSDDDRKKRDRRNRLAVLNVSSALLAALKSMPPLPEGGTGEGQHGSGSPVRHNIDLPWVTLARCSFGLSRCCCCCCCCAAVLGAIRWLFRCQC